MELARTFLDMGFYFGIGGVVTFGNGRKLAEVVKYLPLEKIVLETDSPYLSPVPNRGKRNSSLNLPYVAGKIAELKEITPEQVMQVTFANAEQVYGFQKKNSNRRKCMPTLGNPTGTIEILKKYNFNFQKRFGQNFLIDSHILEKIVESAEITKEDCVLEIGPGIGTMTQYLAESAGQVIAVEIDKSLIPILEDTLSPYDNVTVINEDILKVDIQKLVEEQNAGKPIKVVANLPYYITTPIIMGLFESHVPLDSITIMVQKEVADRMQVGPGTKDYGALSLAVQYYAKPEIVAYVSPGCFIPKPNVGSAVIRLKRYDRPPVEVRDEAFLFRLIRAAFNQRRKTLANGIGNAGDIPCGREQAQEALEKLGFSPSVRGEALTLQEFALLSNEIYYKIYG